MFWNDDGYYSPVFSSDDGYYSSMFSNDTVDIIPQYSRLIYDGYQSPEFSNDDRYYSSVFSNDTMDIIPQCSRLIWSVFLNDGRYYSSVFSNYLIDTIPQRSRLSFLSVLETDIIPQWSNDKMNINPQSFSDISSHWKVSYMYLSSVVKHLVFYTDNIAKRWL